VHIFFTRNLTNSYCDVKGDKTMKYSLKELVDIAVSIEESGYYFYTKCHDTFKNKNMKDIFSFLAEEELRHKDLFEEMLKKISESEGYFSEEYYAYLTAIGKERVFQTLDDIDTTIKNIDTASDIFNLALKAEKDSILWYSELKELYEKDKEAQAVLTQLLNEEKKHVVTILNLKEKMSGHTVIE
jgi:rubrerythrin